MAIEKDLQYERKLQAITERVERIKNFYNTPDIVDEEVGVWRWFYITSQQDINALLVYYNEYKSKGNDVRIPDFTRPMWIYIEERTFFEGEAFTGYTLEGYKQDFNNVIKKFQEIEES